MIKVRVESELDSYAASEMIDGRAYYSSDDPNESNGVAVRSGAFVVQFTETDESNELVVYTVARLDEHNLRYVLIETEVEINYVIEAK